MRPFEYASPQTEAEALELLNDHEADTAVLAGGTDLMNLLRRDLVAPKRVVDIKNVESMQGVHKAAGGVTIGALTNLEEVLKHPALAEYHSLGHVVDATPAIQIQSMGTIGGDLCHLPNCWYFRNGYGLLAMQNGESLAVTGDNRYHAILGNQGPAKFVNASRFAPALIAWGAKVRLIGPNPEDEELLPLEYFYLTPKTEKQGPTVLKPGQLISHIQLPPAAQIRSATYEVMQLQGLDWPLAAAAASLDVSGGIVRDARIVLGHVAPIPWMAHEAGQALVGRQVNADTAQMAGDIAVAQATPLSGNGYKVQLARTAVKRAILRAVDQLEGGL
jgi:xanthine dehydrogenase YagS FAD-binding subunit